jgi:rfaE bifunctional protein nucleotidyltransferase chain/domain
MLYAPASSRGKPLHLPTKAKEVFDVSGAGDTALAAIGAATGAGLGMHEAMQIANAASCVVVSKLGTATANLEEIAAVLAEKPADPADRKIVPAESIAKIAEKYRRQGKTVGFTNGCFDCCHLGHLSSLQEAKSLCDVLVVGVNSDEWIKRHKGPGRPIQDEKTRTSLLAALECVDHVVVFGDETALPLVKLVRPDIIAKEGYAIENWPEGRFVRKAGGKAVVLKRVAGYSTTAMPPGPGCGLYSRPSVVRFRRFPLCSSDRMTDFPSRVQRLPGTVSLQNSRCMPGLRELVLEAKGPRSSSEPSTLIRTSRGARSFPSLMARYSLSTQEPFE